jgi:hypothetical protein
MAGLWVQNLVPSRRFERPTCPLGGDRSIQLSYEGSGGIFAWIPQRRDLAEFSSPCMQGEGALLRPARIAV